jgi:hypothetical protein
LRRKLNNPAVVSNKKFNDNDSQIFPFDSIDINIIRELLAKTDIRSADIASKYILHLNTRFQHLLLVEEEKGLKTLY